MTQNELHTRFTYQQIQDFIYIEERIHAITQEMNALWDAIETLYPSGKNKVWGLGGDGKLHLYSLSENQHCGCPQ